MNLSQVKQKPEADIGRFVALRANRWQHTNLLHHGP